MPRLESGHVVDATQARFLDGVVPGYRRPTPGIFVPFTDDELVALVYPPGEVAAVRIAHGGTRSDSIWLAGRIRSSKSISRPGT